jgi:glycosyltransferase involved in cell wall biosynthesis
LWRDHLFLPEISFDHFKNSKILCFKSLAELEFSKIGYDLIPIYHPEYTGNGLANSFVEFETLLRVTDRVFAISEEVRRDYEHYCANVDRIDDPKHPTYTQTVTLSGSSLTLSTPSMQTNEQAPLVLCVGTIEPRKNHIRILRAAELLWQKGLKFRLLFVGTMGWKSEEIKKEFLRIQAAGLSFSWKSGVSDQDLASFYQEALFTVFCSNIEGYGLPVMESLAVHKPCVVSDMGCMKEFIQMGGCYPVQPGSILSIAEGMETLLTDKVTRQKLLDAIPKVTSKSWDDYAEEIWEGLNKSPIS